MWLEDVVQCAEEDEEVRKASDGLEEVGRVGEGADAPLATVAVLAAALGCCFYEVTRLKEKNLLI